MISIIILLILKVLKDKNKNKYRETKVYKKKILPDLVEPLVGLGAQLLVELALGSVLQYQVDPRLVVEVPIHPEYVLVPSLKLKI